MGSSLVKNQQERLLCRDKQEVEEVIEIQDGCWNLG